jgi:hypothetical protein
MLWNARERKGAHDAGATMKKMFLAERFDAEVCLI